MWSNASTGPAAASATSTTLDCSVWLLAAASGSWGWTRSTPSRGRPTTERKWTQTHQHLWNKLKRNLIVSTRFFLNFVFCYELRRGGGVFKWRQTKNIRQFWPKRKVFSLSFLLQCSTVPSPPGKACFGRCGAGWMAALVPVVFSKESVDTEAVGCWRWPW